MGVRKNILYMTSVERDLFFEALLKMKANIVNPAAPVPDQYSVYDQFASLHWAVFDVSLTRTALSSMPVIRVCVPLLAS